MGDCNYVYKNGNRYLRGSAEMGRGTSKASTISSSLPESLSDSIMGYTINGDEVTTPKGNKVRVSDFEELSQSLLKRLKEQGTSITDPVAIKTSGGTAIMPRSVAERAIELGKEQFSNYQKNLAQNVKGIEEIESAIARNESEIYKQRMSTERGDSRPYRAKLIALKPLYKKYPRAAAYAAADSYSRARNSVKSTLGETAKDEIRRGGDYKKAIKKMKEEWSKYARKAAEFD